MKTLSAALLFLLLLLCGCEENVYELDLRPQGPLMGRDLTCWRHERDEAGMPLRAFPQSELSAIAAAYGMEAPVSEARKYRFEAAFRGIMPQDIGGAGWYMPLASPLGVGGGYSERFRGDDDIGSRLERQAHAAERLVDIVAGWLQSFCGDAADYGQLHRFLQEEFRADVRNLVLINALPNLLSPDFGRGQTVDEQTEQQLWTALQARGLQYLLERRYLTPQGIAAAVHLRQRLEDAHPEVAERALAEFINNQLHRLLQLSPDSDVGARLDEVLGGDAPFTSLRGHIQTLPDWHAVEADWRERRMRDPTAPRPDPISVLGDVGVPILGAGEAAAPIVVRVRLALPVAPVTTNGMWHSDERVVTWSTRTNDAKRLPTQCMAWWIVPAEDFQEAHFGRVLLSGMPLLNYVLAENGLTETERDAWHAFLQSLRPGADLLERIRAYPTSAPARALPRAAQSFEPLCRALTEALTQ